METIFGAVAWGFWTLIGIVFWLLEKLFWIFLWLILPLLIAAFVALRLAESVLGKDRVRAWIKAKSLKYGGTVWVRARRLTFALGVLPIRVLAWFVVYAVWHSIISLIWRPKWSPWQRAWSKRWKPVKRTPSGRPVKAPTPAKSTLNAAAKKS